MRETINSARLAKTRFGSTNNIKNGSTEKNSREPSAEKNERMTDVNQEVSLDTEFKQTPASKIVRYDGSKPVVRTAIPKEAFTEPLIRRQSIIVSNKRMIKALSPLKKTS